MLNSLKINQLRMTQLIVCIGLLFAYCSCGSANTNGNDDSSTGVAMKALSTNGTSEIVDVNFDNDVPGQPPQTGGPGQPTDLFTAPGTTVLVKTSANGIATQPVVLTAQAASQAVYVATMFNPVSEGIVRIEATVAFHRLTDGYFLETGTGSGLFSSAIVTRLITTASGEIQNNAKLSNYTNRTTIGTYAPNQPFRVRMDIDMTSKTWSVAVDDEMNGFDDDPVIMNLPFENPLAVLPTVGLVFAGLDLFPTSSVAPTSVAYDNIKVFLSAMTPVNINIKSR